MMQGKHTTNTQTHLLIKNGLACDNVFANRLRAQSPLVHLHRRLLRSHRPGVQGSRGQGVTPRVALCIVSFSEYPIALHRDALHLA